MLYLHCGWPRTSTTSLQSALFEHRDTLAAAGIVYSDEWRSKTGTTHHGLAELLAASLESENAFDDFKRFLNARAGKDVLFSAEALTFWLTLPEKQEALLRFLAVAGEVTPVRCVWTLRRHDDFVGSLLLLGLKTGRGGFGGGKSAALDRKFAGLRKVEELLGDEVVYCRYDSAGKHNSELLRALGIPNELAADIAAKLKAGPRLHASPSHKEAVLLTHLDQLSARAGFDLDGAVLRETFARGDFKFAQDWRCQPLEVDVRKRMHERALQAARRHGVRSYVEFFAGDEIEDPALGRTPDVLTDRDMEDLVAHLRGRDGVVA
jgi:hypothetical protein